MHVYKCVSEILCIDREIVVDLPNERVQEYESEYRSVLFKKEYMDSYQT